MINQIKKFDSKQKFALAFSGGVDSVAVADFYLKGKKDFFLAHFNHGTSQANDMQVFCEDWAKKNKIKIVVGHISSEKQKNKSPEEFWRDERYCFFKLLNKPIVACHHLDDQIENWIFTSLHGNPRLMPFFNGFVYRPFILNRKQKFIDWCIKNNLTFIEDESNKNIKFPRNRIRHNIVSEAFKINPGLDTVIYKKILQSIN